MTKLQTRNKFCVTMWLDTSTRVKYQKKTNNNNNKELFIIPGQLFICKLFSMI